MHTRVGTYPCSNTNRTIGSLSDRVSVCRRSAMALQPATSPDMAFAPRSFQVRGVTESSLRRQTDASLRRQASIQSTTSAAPGFWSTAERSAPIWPNLGPKAARMSNTDYVKLYGIWRGHTCASVDPDHAALKFLESEKLLREIVFREQRGLARMQELMPLEYVHGVKVGYGVRAASGAIPTDGEMVEREMMQNYESIDVSSNPEMSQTTEVQSSKHDSRSSSRRQRHAHSKSPDHLRLRNSLPATNTKSRAHLQRPHNFSLRQKTWHNPQLHNVLPRVYDFRTGEQTRIRKKVDNISEQSFQRRSLPIDATKLVRTISVQESLGYSVPARDAGVTKIS